MSAVWFYYFKASCKLLLCAYLQLSVNFQTKIMNGPLFLFKVFKKKGEHKAAKQIYIEMPQKYNYKNNEGLCH